jgi:hypothetical protein
MIRSILAFIVGLAVWVLVVSRTALRRSIDFTRLSDSETPHHGARSNR